MVESINIDKTAVLAKTDKAVFEELLREYKPFIMSRARRAAVGAVTESDEISVIGINAFYEAIQAYTPGKGAFLPFAALVIKRRVTDYLRKNQGQPLISLDESDNDEHGGAVSLMDRRAFSLYEQRSREDSLRDEIEELTEALSLRGVTMDDVYKDSPRHRAGRDILQTAVSEILKNEEYLGALLDGNRLLLKKISENTKIPRKKLEVSRRYILACILIATGDYPMLREYLYPEVTV